MIYEFLQIMKRKLNYRDGLLLIPPTSTKRTITSPPQIIKHKEEPWYMTWEIEGHDVGKA